MTENLLQNLRNRTKKIGFTIALTTPLTFNTSCTDVYKEGPEAVANAPDTTVVYDKFVWDFYTELVPRNLQNQLTYQAFLNSVISRNNSGNLERITYGKEIKVPNLTNYASTK